VPLGSVRRVLTSGRVQDTWWLTTCVRRERRKIRRQIHPLVSDDTWSVAQCSKNLGRVQDVDPIPRKCTIADVILTEIQ